MYFLKLSTELIYLSIPPLSESRRVLKQTPGIQGTWSTAKMSLNVTAAFLVGRLQRFLSVFSYVLAQQMINSRNN